DADGRCATHDEPADGIVHLLFIGDIDVNRFERELGLIEQTNGAAGPGNGLEHERIVGDWELRFWILDFGLGLWTNTVFNTETRKAWRRREFSSPWLPCFGGDSKHSFLDFGLGIGDITVHD